MTATLPPRPEGWSQGLVDGCTSCGTQDTDEVCGCHGRRCLDHLAHPDEQEADECQA